MKYLEPQKGLSHFSSRHRRNYEHIVLLVNHETPISWMEASAMCHSNGSMLLTDDNEDALLEWLDHGEKIHNLTMIPILVFLGMQRANQVNHPYLVVFAVKCINVRSSVIVQDYLFCAYLWLANDQEAELMKYKPFVFRTSNISKDMGGRSLSFIIFHLKTNNLVEKHSPQVT